MSVNDLKQIMITRLKDPIDQVQDALDEVVLQVDFLTDPLDSDALEARLKTLQEKVTSLKSLLPTIQG